MRCIVKSTLITFVGQDISRLAVAMFETIGRLYGLNGYALQLEAAVAEALQSRHQQAEKQTALITPGQAVQTVHRNGHSRPPTSGNTHLKLNSYSGPRPHGRQQWR
ncbi:MAG: hypothetical protein HC875_01930 [Anaerolineales bacterium]|nr:hypothetical protein [Anaerolineales bacterium]